ncbi:MAG: GntR family transcriptional regulator [Pirellulales bacterium]|nr:GntR family transcriptional regulator [Pirellulales bacterium]
MATSEALRTPEESVYDRLVELVFSGNYEPGHKLTERDLAEQLQVSRIPVRESLGKMVAQGLLLGGAKREGVRIRMYTPDEIRQLYEFRLFLEVGAARAATRYAKGEDIERLEEACKEMTRHVGEYGSQTWAKLDHQFHNALVQASHNKRAIATVRLLLTESHYVFYLRPSRQRRTPSAEEATAWMDKVQQEHRLLVDHLVAGDADGVEQVLRKHIAPQRF